jgi:hypothetical protein
MAKCPRCDDTGWVCEVHDTVPWSDSPRAAATASPGMPCELCNQSTGPDDSAAADTGLQSDDRRQGAPGLMPRLRRRLQNSLSSQWFILRSAPAV